MQVSPLALGRTLHSSPLSLPPPTRARSMAWATLNSESTQHDPAATGATTTTTTSTTGGNSRSSTKGRRSSLAANKSSTLLASGGGGVGGGVGRSAKKRGTNAYESREVQTEKALELYRRYLLNPRGTTTATSTTTTTTTTTSTTGEESGVSANHTAGTKSQPTKDEDILENLFQSELVREVVEEAREAVVDDSYPRAPLPSLVSQEEQDVTIHPLQQHTTTIVDLQSRPAQFLAYAVLVNMAKRVETSRRGGTATATHDATTATKPATATAMMMMDVDAAPVDMDADGSRNSSAARLLMVEPVLRPLSKEPLDLYTNVRPADVRGAGVVTHSLTHSLTHSDHTPPPPPAVGCTARPLGPVPLVPHRFPLFGHG